MSKRKVIFIGGAPLSGKSTLAKELSTKLGMPWVSTDDIRKWMEALVRKEDYPDLFYGDGLDVVAFYEKFKTADRIFELENQQGVDVQKGVTAMIDSFWWWNEMIIEGIAITPQYAHWLQRYRPEIILNAAFLVDRDRASIQKRLDKRGLWDDAGTYPDYIKPIELEWTILFNNYYERETSKYGFRAHDIGELDTLKAELVRPS